MNKINGNIANDIKATEALTKENWKVITLWECDLKPAKLESSLNSLFTDLKK